MIHPCSWMVTGLNDLNEWIYLDEQINTNDLNGALNEMSYEINSKESFKIIRFTMIEPNYKGNWIFRLNKIELFGQLNSID